MAARRGIQMHKSRRRDPGAHDFGLYMLTDIYTDALVHPSAPWGGHALNLDEVEDWLAAMGGEEARS